MGIFSRRKIAFSVTVVGMMIMTVLMRHLARCQANDESEVRLEGGVKVGVLGERGVLLVCMCVCVHVLFCVLRCNCMCVWEGLKD